MSMYDSLNTMQKQAVFHTEGPLLLLAGAGSGKTRVLTHRIAYLIEEKGVNPWNIMAITFTNKAAGEMRERVDNIVGFGSESIWVSTFHSSCVKILRRYIDRIGYNTDFTIYDTDDQKTVMKDIFKRLNIDNKYIKEKTVLGMISSAKNELLSPEHYEVINKGDYSKDKVIKAYHEYQRVLKKNNALDFDDLLLKTVELLKADKQVLENYQERFKYIMVDEYQDTNTVQFMFINLLASKYNNLCVVGDDDQSIYKFRGANIENILNFEKTYKNTKVIKLEQNYRSTKNIIEAANIVIRNNTERKDKTLWSDLEEGERVGFAQLNTSYEEADYIADKIKTYISYGGKFNDIACLYRTNAQSRVLEEKFLVKNIPYKIIGGHNFYQRKEIKDLLAYLKTIQNGMDDVAVKRIINVPKRGIGLTTVQKIDDFARNNDFTFFDALCNAEDFLGRGKSTEKVVNFATFIKMLKSKKEVITIHELMDEILNTTGYLKELQDENTVESTGRIENINELITKIYDYEEKCEGEPNLGEFLEEVALVAEIDNLEDDKNYVVMMTIHSAKGLEFEKVFLCGMEDGLFPSYMTIASDDRTELEEERRLCYVGITRAKSELTLTCAKSRMLRGETQYNPISRFVKEIPMSLLETSINENEFKKSGIVKPSETSNAKPIFKSKAFDPKQYQVVKETSLEYAAGDNVSHIKFGVGKVLEIVDGGKDYEVTVEFEKAGVKKLFASFAKLKKA